jgi:hypothetical protein
MQMNMQKASMAVSMDEEQAPLREKLGGIQS